MNEASPTIVIDRSDKPGRVGILLMIAGLLVGAAIALGFIANEWAQPLILALLAGLSFIGVFALFAYAIGFIQFGGKAARNDLTKAIVDKADEGVLVTELDGQVVYANQAYLALSGASGAVDPRGVERLFTGGADVSEAVYRLAVAAREGRPASEEIRMPLGLGQAGQPAWYRIRVSQIERPGQRPATLWSVADITREREGQENIFQELQGAIDFLDHAPAGFMSLDAGGDVAYLNATLAGWLDHDLARVGSGGLRLEDIATPGAAAILSAIRGAPGEVRTEIIDLDLKRRNGQALPVRLHHQLGFGQDGRAGPSRTLVLNRTPGEAGADEGSTAEVRFARFFHNAPIAIALLDEEGGVLRANAAFARLGTPKSILELTADAGELGQRLGLARAGAIDAPPVDITIGKDGAKSARIYISHLDGGAQNVGGSQPPGAAAGGAEAVPEARMIAYALETTAERQLKDSVDKAEKLKAVGQLAGGIAHDFNNVLQVIINASEFLLASHKPTDPSFPDIMQIKTNAYRAASLVRQLLAFSRRQTLRPETLQLTDVLSDLQMMLKRAVGDKVALDMRHGRDLWPVKADLGQLEQVVVNLCVNARDAMPDGGKVSIRTRNVPAGDVPEIGQEQLPAADFVMLEVEDTGSGIPPEHLDKIFEPFFTTKEVGKGTGLGLSMVYGIVKQTGGYVFCDSTVGKGTVFRIFLPRHVLTAEDEAAARAALEPVAKKPAADHTGAGTVLLVEDEDAVRAFNARMLASKGYTVLEAASGQEALDLFEAQGGQVDLVVSDVVMPEMDGPTMLGHLRQRNPDTRVIFVSGYAEEAFRRNLPEGEHFHFLPKPFTMKQLIEAVKSAMA
jgi:two-component system cell cycle sensor histidine kinase/response regulator CckA